jgi:Tol biopolymer transport system component
MRSYVAVSVLLPVLSAVAFSQPAKNSAGQGAHPATHKVITVHEGTDMAVTVSPDHKTILMDLQGMIYSVPFTGGAAKRITGPLVEASHPEYSPDGKWVTIQSYAGGTFHIWVMRPDGSGLKQMTTGHGDDREPRWSPDGKTIAFSSDRANKGSYDIWTVDVATAAVKQITTGEDDEYEPAWSPDGKSISYVDGAFAMVPPGIGVVSGRTVVQLDLASGATKQVATIGKATGRIESPSWSPDGKHLAYIQFMGSGMFVDAARLVVDGKPVAGGDVKSDDAFPFPPVWLGSDAILFTANGAMLKADLGAGTMTKIPFTAGIESMRPIYKSKDFHFDARAPKQVLGIFSPALSPDGKEIAFVALNELYLLKVGSSTPVALTHDTYYKQGPMWSPDGKTLAYVSDKDGVENIYLRDMATGTETRPAPSSTEAEIFPAWSPDGKWMAFQQQEGATMLLELSTGKTTLLAPHTFFPGRPAFSTDGKTVAIATVKPYTKRFREGTSSILAVDVATKKTEWYAPAPFESITTRTEDGPIYSPNGKEIAFIMDDLLYTMPVDADGRPSGKAVALNNEVSDAPTYNGDGSKILYLSDGKMRLLDRTTKAIVPVPMVLTYKPLQPAPTDRVLVHAGRFWSGEGPETKTDVDVLVVGNRIASVKPHSSAAPPAGTRVIEAPNSTVMPGLWESHAHPNSDASIYYGDRLGRLWMVYGITTLRDMADQAYRAEMQKESFAAGTAMGPRLFATAEAIDGERTYYPMMIPTTSEAQLHREFEREKALDFDFMKLYVRLPYTWVVEGANFAHYQMGVQTAGHYLLPAVDLGNDGMTHVSATARTGYAYSRSMTGTSYSDVQQLMAESGMWTISTLLNQGVIADMPELADDNRYNLAPPWEKERLMKARDAAIHTDQSGNEDRVMREEATVKGVIDRKGMFVGGTDSPLDLPSTSLHLNIISQVKYGLKPWQALETVTSTAAKAARVEKDLGTLEPGKLADLIIVEGDPLTNIKDVTRVECVMKNGAIHPVAEIMAPFVKSDRGNAICGVK